MDGPSFGLMLISIGSRLVLLAGSGLEMPWKFVFVLRDVILCNLERLVEVAELDRCTGGTATHEEIHNSLLRTNRLERSYLL